MLSVLHCESSLGWGGQENRTLMECLGIRERGAQPVVLCQPGAQLGNRAREAGIPVVECRMRKSFDLPAVWTILQAIQAHRVDVVNTHSGRDAFLAGLAGRLSRRRPLVVRTRHLALPITTRVSYRTLPHAVVAVSRYVKDFLAESGVPAEMVHAIPTGVDLARFDPRAVAGDLKTELGLPASTLLVGTVAILRVKKGHAVLLEAARRVLEHHPDTCFVFAGDGPQRENLERQIATMGLAGKVRLLGLRRDVPNILKSLDLFVLPTFQEALGTAYLEAMAMGRPVIGTQVGGVPEIVRDGFNGRLVPAENAEALAAALLDLLARPAEMQAMGARGRGFVEAEYSVGRMAENMLALYARLGAPRR